MGSHNNVSVYKQYYAAADEAHYMCHAIALILDRLNKPQLPWLNVGDCTLWVVGDRQDPDNVMLHMTEHNPHYGTRKAVGTFAEIQHEVKNHILAGRVIGSNTHKFIDRVWGFIYEN